MLQSEQLAIASYTMTLADMHAIIHCIAIAIAAIDVAASINQTSSALSIVLEYGIREFAGS